MSMRELPYITIGKIRDELSEEGLTLTRITYLRLEKRLNFPEPHRTAGGWRIYTPDQALEIKDKIKQNYNFTIKT